MNAMRRPRGASALAVLVTIAAALTGACLLAGCTSKGGTVTTPVSTGPAGAAPAGSAPASSAPASTGNSPASIAAAALASLKAGRTVHVDITSSDTTGTTSYSDDATATGGQQIITIDGVQHATILFIDNIGYLKANASALAGFIGVPAAQTSALAAEWACFG